MRPAIRRTVLLVVIIWVCVAMLFTAQEYLASRSAGVVVSWWEIFAKTGAFDAIWAAFTLGVIAFVVRYPPGSGRTMVFLLMHLPLSLVVAVLQLGIYRTVLEGLRGASVPPLFVMLAAGWHINLLIYWIVAGVTVGVLIRSRLADREIASLQLEKSLSAARSAALRAQLQPHFLFNTLNAISALVRDEPRTAERIIARLGDLLRVLLDRHGVADVSFAEDLNATAIYLEIEKLRMGDRLSIMQTIASDALGARVPDLLLQPLVENAIRHGLSPLARGGEIRISASRQDDKLIIEVADNGGGFAADQGHEGIGLANTRERIAHFSGGVSGCGVNVATSDNGSIVTLRLPWRTRS